jgi:hypothetical protein
MRYHPFTTNGLKPVDKRLETVVFSGNYLSVQQLYNNGPLFLWEDTLCSHERCVPPSKNSARS